MTVLDDSLQLNVAIRIAQNKVTQGLKTMEVMQIQQRQYDREISYNAGQIDAYTAILRVLSAKDKKTVEKRIAALKEQMGDLSV